MASHAAEHQATHEEVHHYDYVKIWAGLVVLLILSVLGPMVGIKIVTLIAAFGIAIVKAYFVARYFMHVNITQPIVHYFLVTALVFMVIFFAGTSPDVMKHEGQGWVNEAAYAETARAEAAAHLGFGEHHGDAPEEGSQGTEAGHGTEGGGH